MTLIEKLIKQGYKPTPLEESLMNGTFKPCLDEEIEEIPEDILDVQDFHTAMDELRKEIDTWQ